MPIKSAEITLIPEKAKLKGRLETPGTLTIPGSFEGSIKCGTLEILKDGKAFAAGEAESVTIAGYFAGEIVTRKIAPRSSQACKFSLLSL